MADAEVTFANGLWNGRSVRDWVPVVVDDVVRSFQPAGIIVFGWSLAVTTTTRATSTFSCSSTTSTVGGSVS